MKPKLILCLALILCGALVLVFSFFWMMGREHLWTQINVIAKFHSGEQLVREDGFRSGFVQTTLESSKLFMVWTNGQKELLEVSGNYSTANHFALSTDGDINAIGIGRTIYYRAKTAPTNQWNSWKLTASPEIFNFIKAYLDANFPGSYTSDTNEFAPANAIVIKCNRLGEEQPLVIAPQGDMSYGYEVEAIRNRGRELVAAPFASNPFAPKKLIFSMDKNSGGWKFDVDLTTAENKDRK